MTGLPAESGKGLFDLRRIPRNSFELVHKNTTNHILHVQPLWFIPLTLSSFFPFLDIPVLESGKPCRLPPFTVTNTAANVFRYSFPYKYKLAPVCFTSGLGPGSRRSVCVSAATKEREMAVEQANEKAILQKGVAEFYDESSGIWEDIWGDHMHHGFYDPNSTVSVSDHRVAQIRMIEEALRFAGVSEEAAKWPKSIVDVGCGIGGSSRYLATKFGATSIGITLSPIQAQRANALAASQGLADRVSFQVADALEQPFPDGKFDLVWSMESGEHMPDKAKFVSELARVAAPGATIIIVTWCHRHLGPGEESLQPWEEKLLKKICNAYYLPSWCSTADYVRLLESLSLQDIKSADWSPFVAPFWPAVIRSALSWRGLTSLLSSGLKTIKGALAMPLMIKGFKKDVIKFAIITCKKPPE